MSIMKLPDVNFGTAGYGLFGNSQGQTVQDGAVGGSSNPYSLYTLLNIFTYGVSNWPAYGFPGLYLFKGVPPTQAELDTAEASATNVTALTGVFRYSDLLLYMHTASVSAVKNSLQVGLTPSAAVAAGAATWFMLGAQKDSSYYGVFQTGTVGLIGSGADLEIADTNILSGTIYKQPAMNIVFPNSMSV